MRSSLWMTNEQGNPVTVWVEPWGRDYPMLPGDEYRFTAAGVGPDFYFHVSCQERDILLYAEAACEDVTVHQGELELACGRNREHRTDRVF